MRHITRHLFPLALVVACSQAKLSPASPHDPAARQAVLLTANDLAPGRHCRIVDPEVPLPNVAAVLDTAAMPEYLRQAGVSADTGYALFSLRYDSTGGPVRARLIEATFPDSLAGALELAVASAIMPRTDGSRLAARLRVDLAPVANYRIGRSEYCEPEILARHAAGDPRFITRPMGPSASRSVSVYKYDVAVSPRGNVESVRFLTPMDAELESHLRTSVSSLQWQPALDDGAPVAGHATNTISLEVRVESRTVAGP